jgi:hypothetical protein
MKKLLVCALMVILFGCATTKAPVVSDEVSLQTTMTQESSKDACTADAMRRVYGSFDKIRINGSGSQICTGFIQHYKTWMSVDRNYTPLTESLTSDDLFRETSRVLEGYRRLFDIVEGARQKGLLEHEDEPTFVFLERHLCQSPARVSRSIVEEVFFYHPEVKLPDQGYVIALLSRAMDIGDAISAKAIMNFLHERQGRTSVCWNNMKMSFFEKFIKFLESEDLEAAGDFASQFEFVVQPSAIDRISPQRFLSVQAVVEDVVVNNLKEGKYEMALKIFRTFRLPDDIFKESAKKTLRSLYAASFEMQDQGSVKTFLSFLQSDMFLHPRLSEKELQEAKLYGFADAAYRRYVGEKSLDEVVSRLPHEACVMLIHWILTDEMMTIGLEEIREVHRYMISMKVEIGEIEKSLIQMLSTNAGYIAIHDEDGPLLHATKDSWGANFIDFARAILYVNDVIGFDVRKDVIPRLDTDFCRKYEAELGQHIRGLHFLACNDNDGGIDFIREIAALNY